MNQPRNKRAKKDPGLPNPTMIISDKTKEGGSSNRKAPIVNPSTKKG